VNFPEDVDNLIRPTLDETGYGSNFAMNNMGTNTIIITVLFFFIALLALFIPCRKQQNCVGRSHRKCSGIIFWGFWLRMLIQGCLEIEIAALVYMLDRPQLLEIYGEDEKFENFFLINDLMSYGFMAVLIIMPVWVAIFYCYNFKKLEDKKFTERYGSTYDGLRTNRKSILFFPIYFLIRRGIFLVTAIFGSN